MDPISVEVIPDATPGFFRDRVQPARKPVILRGITIGECARKWKDPEYLTEVTDDSTKVTAHVAQTHGLMDFRAKNFHYREMSFNELVKNAAEKPEPQKPLFYLRALSSTEKTAKAADFHRDFPGLSGDFRLPKGFFEPENRFFSSVLRISSANIRMWTHFDVLDNVYVQIVGRKKVTLWAPDQALNMYLDGDKSKIIDIDHFDEGKFPKFKNAQRYEGVLEPGDILFIPSMWFHNTEALDFGVAINVFWKNLDEQMYDKKDAYGNKDLLPGAKSLRMLDNVMKQLDLLPADIKDFYGRRLISRIEQKCLSKDQ